VTDTQLVPRTAVLSVTDKTGLVEFARGLVAHDVQLVASGGTAAALRDAGLPVTAVEAWTRFPEMLSGRVKTLHPALHAGILADRGDAAHRADLEQHALNAVDLVVVNFYDFAAAATRTSLPIEAIDIGGPTLARAAAKNHAWVTVLTHPTEYEPYSERLRANAIDLGYRRDCAARTFARVAEYDARIAAAFAAPVAGAAWPAAWAPTRTRLPLELRYGENPHQPAVAYADEPRWGLGCMSLLQGVELSFNNLLDADAALGVVRDLGPGPACVIVKHANPCGAARGSDGAAAFVAARACDPVSAFGGIAAFNVPVDAAIAEAIGDLFLEVLCAPRVLPDARAVLGRKKRLRVLEVPEGEPGDWRDERRLRGITLVQSPDRGFDELQRLEVMTQRAPSDSERADCGFAWRVCKHVRSNAIVLVRDGRTLGVGAGQMSRVDSCELAVRKATATGHDVRGAVAASDAFFPFPDGVEALARAGIAAIIQPGGSKRDDEVVVAADRLGVAMLCTGRRHFRH
jgi:phosphoribosylaminoimidazolecarboxamide formyltransferase/IMP cyclohydrolase